MSRFGFGFIHPSSVAVPIMRLGTSGSTMRVFKTTDLGVSWSQLTSPSTPASVNTDPFFAGDGTFIFATGGNGSGYETLSVDTLTLKSSNMAVGLACGGVGKNTTTAWLAATASAAWFVQTVDMTTFAHTDRSASLSPSWNTQLFGATVAWDVSRLAIFSDLGINGFVIGGVSTYTKVVVNPPNFATRADGNQGDLSVFGFTRSVSPWVGVYTFNGTTFTLGSVSGSTLSAAPNFIRLSKDGTLMAVVDNGGTNVVLFTISGGVATQQSVTAIGASVAAVARVPSCALDFTYDNKYLAVGNLNASPWVKVFTVNADFSLTAVSGAPATGGGVATVRWQPQ